MEYGGTTPFSTARVPVSVIRGGVLVETRGFPVSPELRWSRTASSRRTP